MSPIAGVDEVGRGCLAGPVVAVAVVLDPDFKTLLKDSKVLSVKERQRLYALLMASDSDIGVASLSARMIDKYNILNATMECMRRAVMQLSVRPAHVIIDGNRAPQFPDEMVVETRVKGDQSVPAISAASIIAKVIRDRIMDALDRKFPQFWFKDHKGYGTQAHYDQLYQHGLSNVHRRSFNLTRQEVLF